MYIISSYAPTATSKPKTKSQFPNISIDRRHNIQNFQTKFASLLPTTIQNIVKINIIQFHKKQGNKQSKSTLKKKNDTEKETFSCQNEQQTVYLQPSHCII